MAWGGDACKEWEEVITNSEKNEVCAMDMCDWCYDYIGYDFMDIYRYQILPHYII